MLNWSHSAAAAVLVVQFTSVLHAQSIDSLRADAELGNASAQFDLGDRYEHGRGVPKNYVLAHMWFSLAASSRTSGEVSRVRAVHNRELLAQEMTLPQITEAQRLARSWGLKHQGVSTAGSATASIREATRVSRPAAVPPSLGSTQRRDRLPPDPVRSSAGSSLFGATPEEIYRVVGLPLGMQREDSVVTWQYRGSTGPAFGVVFRSGRVAEVEGRLPDELLVRGNTRAASYVMSLVESTYEMSQALGAGELHDAAQTLSEDGRLLDALFTLARCRVVNSRQRNCRRLYQDTRERYETALREGLRDVAEGDLHVRIALWNRISQVDPDDRSAEEAIARLEARLSEVEDVAARFRAQLHDDTLSGAAVTIPAALDVLATYLPELASTVVEAAYHEAVAAAYRHLAVGAIGDAVEILRPFQDHPESAKPIERLAEATADLMIASERSLSELTLSDVDTVIADLGQAEALLPGRLDVAATVTRLGEAAIGLLSDRLGAPDISTAELLKIAQELRSFDLPSLRSALLDNNSLTVAAEVSAAPPLC